MPMIFFVHILAGALALGSGYVALYATKGATLHRKSGILFVCTMTTMCAGGLTLALAANNAWTMVNSSAALMTSYLVITSLTTVRRPAAGSRWLEIGGLGVALAIGLLCLTSGFEAIANGGRRNGVPAFPFFLFGIVGMFGSAGDIRMMRSGPLSGAPRLARHLWRMSFALLIAAMSFFLGQARVIPAPLRIMPLLALPVLAVLVTMLYWVWRVRIRRSLRGIVAASSTAMRPKAAPAAISSLLMLIALTAITASAAGPEAQDAAPRTEHARPDLEGVWNFSSDVPLQRPKEFADKKFFTREELDKLNAEREVNLDAVAKKAPVEIADRVWLDYRPRALNLRTSLVIYPENGRLPALVEGVQRVGGLAAILNEVKGTRPVRFFFGGISRDAAQDRGLAERCLAGPNPPFLPGFDSNYVQIFQARDHVALLADTMYGARIVPLDGRQHVHDNLRSWSGDSRGRWEGDTLVVETRNFNDLTQSFSDAGTSYDKVVTERFTRVSDSTLEYEATIVDPKTFRDKIVLSFPMAKVDTRIYESACHEGNYSMSNTLSGARTEEQEAAKAK